MAASNTTPATKEDIELIMEELWRISEAMTVWKEEWEKRIDEKILASEERMKDHLIFTIEQMRDEILNNKTPKTSAW